MKTMKNGWLVKRECDMPKGRLMNQLVRAVPSLALVAAIGAVLLVSASGVARAESQAGGLPSLADRVAVLEAANASLKAALDKEAAARQAADSTLQSAINAEAAARTAAETALQNAINAEAAARIAADNAESANRQSADQSLWTAINTSTTNLTNAIAAAKLKVWGTFDRVGRSVSNFVDTGILYLDLGEPGKYVINAKVSLRNKDGDYQPGNCKLWASYPNGWSFIDETNVRIGAKEDADRVSIALQGVYDYWGRPDTWITLTCSTYNGSVDDAYLTAIQIPE